MVKSDRYTKLVFALLLIIFSIFCFVFPTYSGKYLPLAMGILILIKGLVEWFIRFKDKIYSPLVVPLIEMVSGILCILCWKFISGILFIVGGIFLIGLAVIKFLTVNYYTSVNKSPLYPIINGLLYLIVGVTLIVFSILSFSNDLFIYLIGDLFGVMLAIAGVDILVRFIKQEQGPMHLADSIIHEKKQHHTLESDGLDDDDDEKEEK